MYWIYGIQYNDLHNQDEIQVVRWILTHWGRVTHICISRLTITGSDNGLSPGRRQAIIWTNAGILLIGPLGTNFNENLIEILTFSFTKMRLKVSSAKWRPFCLGLNVIMALSGCEKHHTTIIHWARNDADKIGCTMSCQNANWKVVILTTKCRIFGQNDEIHFSVSSCGHHRHRPFSRNYDCYAHRTRSGVCAACWRW